MRIQSQLTTLLLLSVLTLCNSCDALLGDEPMTPQYYAVQIDEDGDWSIIDADGETIIEEEYDDDDQVSHIYGNTYWVKSDGVYQLYSIDNPRQSLSDEEYTAATVMFRDRCLATRAGQPIEILNAQGELVATLPKDVVMAQRGAANTFIFRKTDETWGWTDRNGKVIHEGFKQINTGEGTIAAVARKTDTSKWQIYDNRGKQVGELSSSYNIISLNDGFISVQDNNGKALVFNHEGKKLFQVRKASYILPVYGQRERCFVTINDEWEYGLVDGEGNELIRPKYNGMAIPGENMFIVRKGDDWGIINRNDQKIVPFKYDNIYTIGDNFLVQKGDNNWRIIDAKGERVGKTSFSNVTSFNCESAVYYVNLEHEASIIDSAAKDFHYQEPIAQLAQRLHITPSENYRWSSTIAKESTDASGLKVTTTYCLNTNAVEEQTHTVRHNDGWWEYTETVHDAWIWSSAVLKSATLQLDFTNRMPSVDIDEAITMLTAELKRKGYKTGTSDNTLTKGNMQVSLHNYHYYSNTASIEICQKQ